MTCAGTDLDIEVEILPPSSYHDNMTSIVGELQVEMKYLDGYGKLHVTRYTIDNDRLNQVLKKKKQKKKNKKHSENADTSTSVTFDM